MMNLMKRLVSPAILLLMLSGSAFAQTAPDAAELTKLLNDFLAGASRNDAAVHDRFWADDLIYTRSAGSRVTKAEVMRGVRSAPAPKPTDPKTVYTAEDIQIQQYGDTAIVAFRLVSTTETGGTKQVANNLNSGTFVKRNGKWQVVSWQSTRMPRTEADSRSEVSAIDSDLLKALAAADTERANALTTESFTFTQRNGQTLSRKQLFDDLSAGKLKLARLETIKPVISIYGDTAIVRGESGNVTHYTLTLVNQAGSWRAVALINH